VTRSQTVRAGRGLVEWVAATILCVVLGAACSGPNGGEGAGAAAPTATSVTTTVPPTTTTAPSVSPTTSSPATTSTTTSPPIETSVPSTTAPATTTSTIAPGPTITVPTTRALPPTRSVTPEEPLRVWVIGDSLVATVGRVIAAEPTGLLEVTVDFRSGSGLVSPFFFDWPTFIDRRLPEVDPEAVVVLIGANDGQAIRTPDGNLATGSPEWIAAYRRLAGATMDALTAGGRRVYWVGPPIMRGDGYTQRISVINDAFRSEIDDRPAVTYVDAFSLFQDADGRYASLLPDRDGVVVQMRDPDGIHYTAAGGRYLALHIVEVVSSQWGLGSGG
jgi:hypothetical protein